MKNLSAIPRLFLSETFTILITLVVCLAGFTVAEVNGDYRKQDFNQAGENLPYSRDTSKVAADELLGRSYENLKNFPDSPALVKRELSNIGESDEYDQNENYGYDDDDYYHVNFKRSETDTKKHEPEIGGSANMKDTGQNFMNSKAKPKQNEYETIEMLNFKESHPIISQENNSPSKEDSIKCNRKNPASPPIPSLKMSDLKENSAIDGKNRDNKDESSVSGGSSSQSKLTEAKKPEEKDPVKLKDSSADESEKKEKDISLKEEKQAIAPKPLKETSDEKDKTVKLSETSKLVENDKLEGKHKESDTKLKERTNDAKITSDLINPSELSDNSNRASFVSNDYKDNLDSTKASALEGDEKNSEESNGVESKTPLNEYQKRELKRTRERFGKMYNLKNLESSGTYAREVPIKVYQEPNKPSNLFSDYQTLNTNDIFKKREWREPTMNYRLSVEPADLPEQQNSLEHLQPTQDMISQETQQFLKEQEQALLQADTMSQVPQEMNVDIRLKNPYGLNLPQNVLENTEYHKNFLKSLKRYKGLNEEQKNIPGSGSGVSSSVNPFSNSLEENKNELKGVLDEKELEQNHLRRDITNKVSSPQMHMMESQTSQGVNSENTNADKGRTRRKSQKLEYEIKVINHSPRGEKDAEFFHASKRFEKDVKSNSADRYLKKYPYSQVSRDDLVNLGNLSTEKKIKRKASIWKRHDQKSLIQPRAVPSGYYSNRVKFGQKSLTRNNENPELTSFRQNPMPPPSLNNQISAADKNKMMRSWETRQQEFKHDPIKRFDSNGSPNQGSPLLLVRKSDRAATPFDEESPQSVSDNDLNSENLAKMLSNNNGYLVFKNSDNENTQKLSKETPGGVGFTGFSYPTYSSENAQQEDLQKKQPFKNKGLFARSSHPFKDDRKVSSGLHNSKSNLKKTFEKFRDLAGFFKDNEQESSDNQYQGQELKEGRDIVFSEDKLPDPIVISNDANEKFSNFNQKPLNSIYSISTNFKTLDQQQEKKSELPSGSEADKNMLTAEAKSDNLDSSWEPALKSAFPEAKSVNAVSKNGNEIIILDLNRNQLKPSHPYASQMRLPSRTQQYGAFGYTSQLPTLSLPVGDKKIQITFNPKSQQQLNSNSKKNTFKINSPVGKTYNLVKPSDTSSTPLQEIIKALMDTKVVTKRSLTSEPSSGTENYKKILQELNELSDTNMKNLKKVKIENKRNANGFTYSHSNSLSELLSRGSENVKCLGNLLKDIMADDRSSLQASNPVISNVLPSEDFQKPELSVNYWPGSEEEKLKSLYTGPISRPENGQLKAFWEERYPTVGDRLRREGSENEKLQNEIPESQPDTVTCQSMCSKPFPEVPNSHTNNISDGEDQQKSEYENRLNEFFESLYKNQREPLNLPNESTWKRKKRKEIYKEKRSAGNDNRNKVSTAEHNTILKNLAEDNYQSVYSPGIKRRLLSTSNEADDADNKIDAYEHDKDVLIKEAQQKDSLKGSIDPLVHEIFQEEVEGEEEKIRSRRSLNSGFHSNFKREIDLDESMPNDFQNFLVTSVGGFGSQTREALKKDDALWEGKAEPNEDFFLAKRDVSSIEKQKSSSFGKQYIPSEGKKHNANLGNMMNPLQQPAQKDQTSKASVKGGYTDEKLPTQIRIQITNASTKEKKSSKPIMDEGETTPTETENLPKEKEFLDKNKGTVREDVTKLRHASKNRFVLPEYYEPSYPYNANHRIRKKKKNIPEDSTRQGKDYLPFDQKAMESLLKRVLSQQSMMSEQTTHRSPIGNHLPQVETVYNPTQESNKAQLHPAHFGKMSAEDANSKVSGKTNLQTKAGTTNLKKKEKLNSENPKDEEEGGWPNFSKLSQNYPQSPVWDLPNLKPALDGLENEPSPYLYPYNQKRYHHSRLPANNYFCRISPDSGLKSKSLYDALKLRQELKSRELRNQRHEAKLGRNNEAFGNENYFPVNRKSPNAMLPYEGPWSEEYLSKASMKNKLSQPYTREGKLSAFEHQDNSNNVDYFDGMEDDYLEWLDPSEPLTTISNLQNDYLSLSDTMRKNGKSPFETPSFRNSYFRNTLDGDDEEEDEPEEDYGENMEDEDIDDFSLLTSKGANTPVELRYKSRRNPFSSYMDHVGTVPLTNFLHRNRNMKLREGDLESQRSESGAVIPGGQSLEQDAKPDMELTTSSTKLLRKANRNSNILENNLRRNTYDLDMDGLDAVERNWKIPARLSRKISRRGGGYKKLRREYPTIDKRRFYASKLHSRPFILGFNQNRKIADGRQPYQNSFNAAFADPDNNFENDSEENGKQFSESILTLGKNSQEDKNSGNENTELDDVTENLEDNTSSSEDNTLENVIGKYIVRKRVASPLNLSKTNETPPKRETTAKHKIIRRSLENTNKGSPVTKKITKRLSSGHLTENNFRKYHKKNLSKKQAEVTDSASSGTPKKRKVPTLTKRSALDIFRKITNKDHESKKVESADCRSAGFEPLLSLNDKKYEIPNPDTHSQMKNLISNDKQVQCNTAQFKPRNPIETFLEGDHKKKEKIKTAENPKVGIKGPWKIELNSIETKNLQNSNGVEGVPANLNSPNRILVFTARAITPEHNPEEELLPVSGSFQKEVGNSYRAKYAESRGSSKRHFRKRSLDFSLSSSTTHEDAVRRGHFDRSAVNLDTNRALHDKKSPSDGDSTIPELPLQRNTKKIRSFVNAVDKCQNARLPSMGSSNNQKSIFPPSNDANILRDSRHINEEMSKYLGQQIVDAIWTHVSGNPKLKELIAPALVERMAAYKKVEIRKTSTDQQQEDISNQLQNFLLKFMNDLEKLAEKHVKKRMCNKIDPQSKQFLQTLLSVPLKSPPQNKFRKEKLCECLDDSDTNWSEFSPNPANTQMPYAQEYHVENLSKKHFLLMKLIDDYRKLSSLEKETLGVDYNKLLGELYKTRLEMSSLKVPWCTPNPCGSQSVREGSQSNCESVTSNPTCSVCNPTRKKPPPKTGNGSGFERLEENHSSINWGNSERKHKVTSSLFFDEKIIKGMRKQGGKSNHDFEEMSQPPPEKQTPQTLPTYVFEEDPARNVECQQVQPFSSFEVVEPANVTKPDERFQKTTEGQSQHSCQSSFFPSPTPETFDLLPFPTSSEKMENLRRQEDLKAESRSQISETTTEGNSEKPLVNVMESEIQKLGLGDSAGLQLSLNSRNPWVSNLDIAKTFSNPPNSKIGFEGRQEIPNKGLNSPTLKKTRSIHDFQSNVGKTFGFLEKLPPEYLKTRVDGSGKKRKFHRSNDPFRFGKDETSVSDVGIFPSTSKQEKREDPETADNDESELEYLTWSSMPADFKTEENLKRDENSTFNQGLNFSMFYTLTVCHSSSAKTKIVETPQKSPRNVDCTTKPPPTK